MHKVASYTTNLNLKKPATTDLVAIGDINSNMDTIDTAVAGKYATTGGNIKGAVNVRNTADTVTVASMDQNGYVTGTWLKTTANVALSSAAALFAVINNGWIYSRTASEVKSDIGLGNVDNTADANKSVASATTATLATKAKGLIYIEGNSEGTAGTWTGTSSDITEYYDGLMIAYLVQIAGASTGTTLNINGLGAVTCVRQATTGVSTSYPVGSVLIMIYKTYNSAHYWSVYDNTGSDTKVRQTLSTTNKNYPLLMSYSVNTATTTNTDNVSYRCNDIYANPSTGAVYATKFYANGVEVGGSGATIFTNLSASSWVADATYTDYPYRCAIALSGVTASDVAEVIYAQEQASSGEYAQVCQTYAGGVYVYSAVNTSITIPTIVVHQG